MGFPILCACGEIIEPCYLGTGNDRCESCMATYWRRWRAPSSFSVRDKLNPSVRHGNIAKEEEDDFDSSDYEHIEKTTQLKPQSRKDKFKVKWSYAKPAKPVKGRK